MHVRLISELEWRTNALRYCFTLNDTLNDFLSFEQAIRSCTTPNCSCDCFTPGKTQMRICDTCHHGWISHGKTAVVAPLTSDMWQCYATPRRRNRSPCNQQSFFSHFPLPAFVVAANSRFELLWIALCHVHHVNYIIRYFQAFVHAN